MDLLLAVTYTTYFVLSFIYSDPTEYLIVSFQCALVFIFAVYFSYNLRMFDSFGFLIDMVF